MKNGIHAVGLALTIGAFFSAAMVLSRAQTGHVSPKYLLTDKKLVLLSAPQIVAGPVVLDAKWSSDGVHVIAIRKTERTVLDNVLPVAHLVLWSAGRQSHEIWRKEMALASKPHVAWLSNEIATVELEWGEEVQVTDASGRVTSAPVLRQGVLWVDAAHDQVKMIPEIQGDHLYVSPSRAAAILFSPAQHRMTVLKPDGNPLKTLPLPEKTTWPRYHIEDRWAADGLHVWLEATEPLPGKAPAVAFKTYALNVQTGEMTEEIMPDMSPAKPHPVALRLALTDQEVKLGRRTQRVHPLWLESTTGGEQPEVMLAADSTGGTLCPTGESVLYFSEQAAWVTPLRIGPKEPFVSNLKATLASNGKQIALAMMMYAADYDGQLPSPNMGVQSAFEPYHKSNDLYEGFNYTFPGGLVPPGEGQAGAQLGSIDGPGGSWIIFGDGHLKWQPR